MRTQFSGSYAAMPVLTGQPPKKTASPVAARLNAQPQDSVQFGSMEKIKAARAAKWKKEAAEDLQFARELTFQIGDTVLTGVDLLEAIYDCEDAQDNLVVLAQAMDLNWSINSNKKPDAEFARLIQSLADKDLITLRTAATGKVVTGAIDAFHADLSDRGWRLINLLESP